MTELERIDFPDLDEVNLPDEKAFEDFYVQNVTKHVIPNISMNASKTYENVTNSQKMVKFIFN